MTTMEEFLQDEAYDDYMEKQYLARLAEEGADAFNRERLQAYYRENPTLAEKSRGALTTAEMLADVSPSASLVFAAVSLELTIKNAILTPIVYGLVHNKAVASLIARYAVREVHPCKLGSLLLDLLPKVVNVNLRTYRREGASRTLWEEVCCIKKTRNTIVHDGQDATHLEANHALDVSRALLHEVFPQVVRSLDMTTDEEFRVV